MLKKSALEKILDNEMSDIWSVLTTEQKRIVTDNFKVATFKRNEVIYSEGDRPEDLWCLLSGKVKMYKSGVGERVQILRLYRPVQFFGYRAYFAEEPYVSTAAAFESSTLGHINMQIVDNLINDNARLARFFINELSRNLGGSDTKIVNLTQKHIRGRLAESLLLLADNYGYEEDGSTLRIYMSREDLANMSNMTTSNAIRTLAAFVDEKLLIVDGRIIKVINPAKLRRISKYG